MTMLTILLLLSLSPVARIECPVIVPPAPLNCGGADLQWLPLLDDRLIDGIIRDRDQNPEWYRQYFERQQEWLQQHLRELDSSDK